MESNDYLQQIRRAVDLGDREEQYRLGSFYEEQDAEQSAFWYRQAALQGHDLANEKCKELGISFDDAITDMQNWMVQQNQLSKNTNGSTIHKRFWKS